MKEYVFTLRFTLPSADGEVDEFVELLGKEGCDDALIGIGHPGRIALDFMRSGRSAREAILGAISDVRRAIPGAELVEVTPDLVGATDVADMVGCSRQNIRQLMIACSSKAPAPLHEGKQAIWHLAPVLDWLVREKHYKVDRSLLELAQTTMQVNLAVDSLKCDPGTQVEIRALFA